MEQTPTLMLDPKTKQQAGQTLVETMVASLVLVLGIGAAVSLSIYGLGATTSVTKQLIAVGLAREGVEAVKNMRDTNWLRDPAEINCHNFQQPSMNNGLCYQEWLNATANGGYNIDPSGTTTYALGHNTSLDQNQYWELLPFAAGEDRFGLNFNPDDPKVGFYSTDSQGVKVGEATSDFARMITLTEENFAPFDVSTGPRLKVTVDVWWKGKRCPVSATPPSGQACKVTLETYLTNWKDYD